MPARLTALLIALRAPQRGAALRIALRDHGLAPSPNGGWPMAAMAGGLGVRLVKRDSYAFNAEAPAPGQPTSRARWESSVGRALMVQGCTSHAGKSYLTAALCRLLADEGLRVAPFKAQNMSNNAGVTEDGRELGRAQIVQAAAARIAPEARMNPVLIKPGGRHSLAGRRARRGRPRDLAAALARAPRRGSGPSCAASLHSLLDDFDVVVIEGAGSPAEINLRDGDIVNMAVALDVAAPVLLCCDIDRGGAFAHLLGTWHCLAEAERKLLAGFLLNRFRGDPSLLAPGPAWLEERTGVPTLGVVPWLDIPLPEEDGVALQGAGGEAASPSSPCPGSRTWTSSRRSRTTCAGRARRPRSRPPRRSSSPAPRARWPIWSGCARRASRARSLGRPPRACRCSASAAACRCSAARCATRTASRAAARRPASACSTS